MKNKLFLLPLIIFLFTFSSCELAGDIFEGGFYIGILVVLIVLGLIFWGIRKLK